MAARALILPAAVCTACLYALLGCKDTGTIGQGAAALVCEPECAADERCDPELGTCTPCGDGCEGPAEAPGCDGGTCACGDDQDCEPDAPMCIDGRCSECEEDDDCDGSGERDCQDGRCVVVDGEGDDDSSEGSDDDPPDDG